MTRVDEVKASTRLASYVFCFDDPPVRFSLSGGHPVFSPCEVESSGAMSYCIESSRIVFIDQPCYRCHMGSCGDSSHICIACCTVYSSCGSSTGVACKRPVRMANERGRALVVSR